MKLTKSRMKQIIKEEVDNLKQEGMFDFIKKNNLEENEEYEETSEVSDSELEQMVATWNTSIGTDGNPSWKKRHNIRSAHVVPDQAAGKWNWVVFERTRNDEEEDIAQGTAASFREAILAAEEALASGGQQYEIN